MKKNLLQKWYVHQQLELTHIIRIMKLSVFFIFVFLFQLQAGNVKSQEVRVTLSKSNLTFGELMREIEKQTNYLFMYREKHQCYGKGNPDNGAQKQKVDV